MRSSLRFYKAFTALPQSRSNLWWSLYGSRPLGSQARDNRQQWVLGDHPDVLHCVWWLHRSIVAREVQAAVSQRQKKRHRGHERVGVQYHQQWGVQVRLCVHPGGLRRQRVCTFRIARSLRDSSCLRSDALLVRQSYHRGRYQTVYYARSIRCGLFHTIQVQSKNDPTRLSKIAQMAQKLVLGHEWRNQRRRISQYNVLCAHQSGIHIFFEPDCCSGWSSKSGFTIGLDMYDDCFYTGGLILADLREDYWG